MYRMGRAESFIRSGQTASVEIVAATDAAVMVYGMPEVLKITEEAIDARRLVGLPVLRDHVWSVDAIIGRVSDWRIEDISDDGTRGLILRCEIVSEEAIEGLENGTWRDVSIGYAVIDSAPVSDATVVTRWMPIEVSFVAVPADTLARTRSAEASTPANTVGAADVAQAEPSAEAEALVAPANAGKEDQMERDDVVRAAGGPDIRVGRDETITARDALVAEIADTLSGRGKSCHGFRSAVARAMGIRGEPLDAADMGAVVRAATHVSSDFPLILGTALNKAAMSVWEASSALRWWEKIGARHDYTDSRPVPRVSFEGFGLLPLVPEGDAYDGLTAPEAGETLTPRKYGGDLRLTEEMVLADDLGMFGRTLAEAQRAALRRCSAVALAALTADTLRDGKTAVHADHGNKAPTGAAPSPATLAVLEGLLLNAVDAAGNPIGMPARYLLAPPALRQGVEGMYAPNYTVSDPDDAVIVALDPENRVYLPGMTGTAYYLIADDPEVLVYGYMRDHGGPRVTEYPMPQSDAMAYHLTLWFGAVCGRYQRIAGNAGA